MFHHRLPIPPDEKEEEEETYDEINIMRPVYGVTSIEWNYVQYNTSRSKKDQVGILRMIHGRMYVFQHTIYWQMHVVRAVSNVYKMQWESTYTHHIHMYIRVYL